MTMMENKTGNTAAPTQSGPPGHVLIKNHVLRDHILAGGIFTVMLSAFFDWKTCLVFWVASVMVDVDHYLNLLYWSRFRSFDPSKLFRFYAYFHDNRLNRPFMTVEVFHTIEFVMLLGLAAFLTRDTAVNAVLWGTLFHIAIDFVHLFNIRALKFRKHSLLEFIIRKRALEKEGIFPTAIQREAGEKAAAGKL